MKHLKTLSATPEEISRVRHAASILEKDLSRHYPIPELASLVLLNRNKLQTLFAAEYGMAPYTYLQELRLLKAKEMIMDDQNIRRISISLGFTGPGTVTNFTKFFKKRTGYSPVAWKRTQQRRAAG